MEGTDRMIRTVLIENTGENTVILYCSEEEYVQKPVVVYILRPGQRAYINERWTILGKTDKGESIISKRYEGENEGNCIRIS